MKPDALGGGRPMTPRLLGRLRCELSASHLSETRAEFCAHGPTVHTHFVTRCARCGAVFRERDEGESLASLLLGLAALVLLFVAAFVLLPVLAGS